MEISSTLGEIIANLQNIDERSIIYVARGSDWSVHSPAIVDFEPESGGLPPLAISHNMEYFLEVSIAKETLDVWTEWHNGKNPSTLDEKCKIIIYYAYNDAYLTDQSSL